MRTKILPFFKPIFTKLKLFWVLGIMCTVYTKKMEFSVQAEYVHIVHEITCTMILRNFMYKQYKDFVYMPEYI